MRKGVIVLILLFGWLSFSADFDSLLKSAFEHNREIKSAKKEAEASKYLKKSAQSMYYPQIEADYFKIDYDKVPLILFPIGEQLVEFPISDDNFTQFTLSLDYLIYDFGGRKSAYKTAKKGFDAAVLKEGLVKRQVALELLERYLQALNVKNYITAVTHGLDAVEKHIEAVKEFRKEGLVPKSDLLRLQALALNLQSEREKLKGTLNTLLNDMERITGTKVSAEQLQSLKDIELNVSSLPEKAVLNREEPRLVEVERDVNKLRAEIEKSLNLPRLVAKVEYSNTTNNLNPVKTNTVFYVGVKFKLFDGFKNSYRRKNYLKLAEKSETLLSDVKDKIRIQLENELSVLNSLEKQYEYVKKAFDASKENYRIVKLQFEEHIVSSVDLKDAIADLKEAEANYLNTLEKLKAQKIKILWLSKKIEGETYEK